MVPKSKLNRALQWARKRRAEEDQIPVTVDENGEEILPTDEELRAEGQKVELEKGDLKAMMLAGLVTILPVCILVLALFGLLCYLFLSAF